MPTPRKRRFSKITFLFGLILGILAIIGIEWGAQKSSSNEFCQLCHIHPHATQTWKTSPHYDNRTGVYVKCVDCHLPPKDSYRYYTAKAYTGARDVWGKLFKDPEKMNWDVKSTLDHAIAHTYESSCKRCHVNIFPIGMSKKGESAHLYYNAQQEKESDIHCLNCHLRVGHFSHKEQHAESFQVVQKADTTIYTEPATVTEFINFTEFIPGTSVKFDMIAIPGGSFMLGSPKNEPFRKEDEGPQVKVNISPFWMTQTEVTWDEFEAFFVATSREGRTDTRHLLGDVDGITGPTPPYEPPDQGWGRGSRPAITMTFHAAQVYCQWLSEKTGKTYRLPTEAEWEYAARGATTSPYFFDGNPKKFSSRGFLKNIFKPDTSGINSFAVYALNSTARSQEPAFVQPNPFGLLNMLGNVREFCLDWYAKDTYSTYTGGISDPKGPSSGGQHVVRGGSYLSDAADLRSASRDSTDHDRWMVTDPQMPKSLWWYSDVKDVGIRVVCEYNE